MDMNEHFVARMQVQLKAWDAELDALAAESARAGAAARAEYQVRIRDLRASRDAASRTVRRLGADTEMNAWQRLQKVVEKILNHRP